MPAPPAGAQNVLLIVWDTVRIDNLSLHGYPRKTSPNLERLAAGACGSTQAFATAPWTLPSHSSLFTARWPHELSAGWLSPLDATHTTLAEYLAAHGYDTAGFVANLDYCSRETGVSRGFAHYEDYPDRAVGCLQSLYRALGNRLDLLTPASVLNRLLKKYLGDAVDVIPHSNEHAKNAATVDRAFLAWLSWQRKRDRPFFAFLNFNDAHSPYEVPDRSIPGFGLRPVSYVDRLTLKSWDKIDKTQVRKRMCKWQLTFMTIRFITWINSSAFFSTNSPGRGCSTRRWWSSPRITASIWEITDSSSMVAVCTGNWSEFPW